MFRIELPLPEVHGCTEVTSTQGWQIIGFKEAQRRILVIDDQRENRFVMTHLLTSLGFQVREAQNGQEGLDQVRQLNPDLVITDLVMPVMDGFEFTRRLRSLAEFRHLPIIASSASVFDSHQQASLAAGCNAFLPKPFQAEMLLGLLQELLNLTWIYDEERAVSSSKLLAKGPSPQQATTLWELAKIGDIMGILDFVTYLEEADAELKPFVSQVRQLAREFEDETICQLAARYVPSECR
jgi:CheY-like chemotaxis protein